jgi:hypothetical protein
MDINKKYPKMTADQLGEWYRNIRAIEQEKTWRKKYREDPRQTDLCQEIRRKEKEIERKNNEKPKTGIIN